MDVVTLKRKVQVSADKSMGKAVKRRRALETVEDTLRRQAQNRTRMASMRASETREKTLRRQEQDRTHRANERKRSLLVEDAIAAFHSEIKLGPDCVCTCSGLHLEIDPRGGEMSIYEKEGGRSPVYMRG